MDTVKSGSEIKEIESFISWFMMYMRSTRSTRSVRSKKSTKSARTNDTFVGSKNLAGDSAVDQNFEKLYKLRRTVFQKVVLELAPLLS